MNLVKELETILKQVNFMGEKDKIGGYYNDNERIY